MRGGNRESALVNLRIDPFSIITLLWTAFAALWVVGVVLVLLARGSVGRRERGWRRAGQSLCKGALGASVVLFIFFTATSSDWLWAATLNLCCSAGALASIAWHNRALKAQSAHLCPRCDYDLRGLTEDEERCPECGRLIGSETG